MMNREFLEALYANKSAVGARLKKLSEQNCFCAEICPQCDRQVNSDYPAHKARIDEVDHENTTVNTLLDLYWQTHNGGNK